MKKEDILDILVEKTMDYVLQRRKEERYRVNGDNYKVLAEEKTIRAFIESKLIERRNDDDSIQVFFSGEYKYSPELWGVESESQIKKIINYTVFKNMSI